MGVWFWVVKWLKCLILIGFYDMGYDKGFWWVKFRILLDFVGILMISVRWNFEESLWINQLIVIPGNIRLLLVFATPYTLKATVFLYFSVGLIIEQTFNRIRFRLTSRTNPNICLDYDFIVFFEIYYWQSHYHVIT